MVFPRENEGLIRLLEKFSVYSDLAPIRITLGLAKSSAIKLQCFFWLFWVK
jgi:hypothetical protein